MLGIHTERCISAVRDGVAVSVYVAMCICTASVYREGEFVKCMGIFRDERCYINVNFHD